MQLLSNLDYLVLVKELNEKLAGAYVNKVYLLEDGSYRFKFHKKDVGELNLIIEVGVRVNFATEFSKTADDQDALVNICRQYLDNAKVKEVKQLNFDRIFALEFNNKTLVFEMFGDGNVLLLDGETIAYTGEKAQYSARTIKRGEKYLLPPSGKISPLEVKPSDLSEAMGKVVSSLSKIVNLSPFYLEEACTRAGVEYTRKIDELSEAERKAVCKCIRELSEEFSPRVYVNGSSVEFFAPFVLKKLENLESKTFDCFSDCVGFYFTSVKRVSRAVSVNAKKREDKVKSLERRLQAQLDSIKEFEVKEGEATSKANWLLIHASEVEELAKVAKENPDTLKSLKKVEKKGSELILNVTE